MMPFAIPHSPKGDASFASFSSAHSISRAHELTPADEHAYTELVGKLAARRCLITADTRAPRAVQRVQVVPAEEKEEYLQYCEGLWCLPAGAFDLRDPRNLVCLSANWAIEFEDGGVALLPSVGVLRKIEHAASTGDGRTAWYDKRWFTDLPGSYRIIPLLLSSDPESTSIMRLTEGDQKCAEAGKPVSKPQYERIELPYAAYSEDGDSPEAGKPRLLRVLSHVHPFVTIVHFMGHIGRLVTQNNRRGGEQDRSYERGEEDQPAIPFADAFDPAVWFARLAPAQQDAVVLASKVWELWGRIGPR